MGGSWSLTVGVMLPGSGPLAVIRALLCPLQVWSNDRPQRTAPGHVCMGQQRKGAQLSPGLPRQEVVGRPGHDDRPW